MDILAQRELGLKLAQRVGADAVRDVIGDRNADYAAIFAAAQRHVRPDALIDAVLEGPPEWAFQALANLANVSPTDTARLAARAADDPATALAAARTIHGIGDAAPRLTAAAGTLADSQGTIAGLYLNNKGSYNCAFTMRWIHGGKILPEGEKAAPVWSSKLMVGQDAKMPCTAFPSGKAVLSEGDWVWLYMWVEAGRDIESSLRFTYSSKTADYACFTSAGCTQNDSLGLDRVGVP